ncbi:hypothetical protein C0Q70_21509 [Pomacea canaliculata]|uniref:Uncharacterized protein n=1 Tax=Pomacea canaliculata TaxID=400727 RepID=A0A2T7NCP9_POMCA|nr:hypothetical protein C0Q70_21509 [Pomacea canaliculata]
MQLYSVSSRLLRCTTKVAGFLFRLGPYLQASTIRYPRVSQKSLTLLILANSNYTSSPEVLTWHTLVPCEKSQWGKLQARAGGSSSLCAWGFKATTHHVPPKEDDLHKAPITAACTASSKRSLNDLLFLEGLASDAPVESASVSSYSTNSELSGQGYKAAFLTPLSCQMFS